MKKIFSIGSATEDIFILYEGAETLHLHLQKKERSFLLFEQGTKIDVPTLHYATGGGATNAAVGFKRLGLDTEAFFKIGADVAGQFVYEEMLKEKVEIGHCIVDSQASTAISFIIPSIEHNHVVLCYHGTSTKLSLDEFPLDVLKDYDFLYIGPLSGRSGLLLPFLATKAKALAIRVAANPSMTQIIHEKDLLQSALSLIDILIVNAFEAEHLMTGFVSERAAYVEEEKNNYTEKPKLLTHFISANDTILTLYDYFEEVFKRGPSIGVVTNGAEGVYVATKDVIYFHPSLKADVVLGLGAGDAFSSAFVGSLALGKKIEQAILYGIINASSVINFADAKEGLLTEHELNRRAQLLGLSKLQKFSR